MRELCSRKSKQSQLEVQQCSGSEADTDLKSISDYEPCTSDGTDDSGDHRYDPYYLNSTHQPEYTNISDYEDAVTSSEDELPAGTFAVSTGFSSASKTLK
jgi:hypothetical protein